jgi:hypothetical protein
MTAAAMMVIGMSLVFYGIIGLVSGHEAGKYELSDEEIINRAEDLGYVKLTEKLNTN